MKTIEPVSIWDNGTVQKAKILNAYIIYDNLATACTFYYQLCSSGKGTEAMPLVMGQTLADGNITMAGDDYINWDDSNDSAYSYIAEKLNLTIL